MLSQDRAAFVQDQPVRTIDFTAAPAPAPTPRSASAPNTQGAGPSETSPLLSVSDSGVPHPSYTFDAPLKLPAWRSTLSTARHAFTPESIKAVARTGFHAVPAVVLGSLLNILDGVSCGSDSWWICNQHAHYLTDGMIIFPASGAFADAGLGPVGVSMFFVSAIIAQVVYSAGGSGFLGGNGSMMIEVVVSVFFLCSV
jgi:SulP family sulfate permease